MLKNAIYTPDGSEGNFIQFHGTNGVATLLWRSRHNDSKLTPSVIALANALNSYGGTMLKQADVLNEKGYRTKAEEEAANLTTPWNNLRKDIMDQKLSLSDRRNRILKVEGGNVPIRSEYRQWFRKMSLPELFELLLNSKDPELLASAIEGGPALLGLDAAVFERIEERYAVVKFLYGGDKTFLPAPVTIENLAGIDPDWTELETRASDQWADIVNGSDEVDVAEQYLAGVLTLIAVSITDMTNEQAFEILKAA